MRTKDWKAINTPQILVVGEDSNLQWSETVAKYAMFADYYFRNFPEDHGERSRNVESRNLFDYIMELTDHQLTPEDVYITNLCNDEVEARTQGKKNIHPGRKSSKRHRTHQMDFIRKSFDKMCIGHVLTNKLLASEIGFL
ncbi:hypothetical protein NXX53_18710 [Bacteroides salyersiae]|nr:hypothetical protein [Bacteroides salyersiae]